ncbi:MAG: hypothetical protein NVS9B10_09100 [Nevskia sp.]
MKLLHPFYRLPLRFDAARLQAEIAQFDEADWQRHPSGYRGNSAIRLISVDGAEDDRTVGRMAPAAALARCPYIRQVLEHFGVVWSRSRLMRLAPGATVPEHSDINYHWFSRVRIHIPVVTAPGVRFHGGAEAVHMAAGEAWVFDNWRRHSVVNASEVTRVHLVADTAGSAAFWEGVLASQHADFEQTPGAIAQPLPYRPNHEARLQFERHNSATVLPPAEVESLIADLAADLETPPTAEGAQAVATFRTLLAGFCREWRLGWSLHADEPEGWPKYTLLRDYLSRAVQPFETLRCASNGMGAVEVLQARVLVYALNPQRAASADDRDRTLGNGRTPVMMAKPAKAAIERPVFIIAAPRSGSTLLFETLAEAEGFVTVGGEAHGLTERLPGLRPGAPGVDSNRLDASHVDEAVIAHVDEILRAALRDRDGQPPMPGQPLRVLEKTPKNALRIPFFDRLYPDARYIFLWRDPRENLSSIIEAWRSGKWVTYRELPGRAAPWSLLLPPGWQRYGADAALEDIAAFQWAETNRLVLDDLEQLPRARWTHLSYAAFLADPAGETRKLCAFAGIAFDERLEARTQGALPLSVHTHTPPAQDKWRRNEALIARVLPQVAPVLARLQAL